MMYALQAIGYAILGVALGVPLGEALRPLVPPRHRQR